MLVSHSHRLIFLKTRKTGGSSFERYIYENHFDPEFDIVTGSKIDGTPWVNCDQSMRGHISWKEIKASYPKEWNEYTRVTIERNSWDKVVSQFWFFRKQLKKPECQGDAKTAFNTSFINNPQNMPTDWSRYASKSSIQVDCVLQYNDLSNHIDTFFKTKGINFDYDKWNAMQLKSGFREDSHYSEMYEPNTIEFVSRCFQHEVSTFGYEYTT